MGVSPMSTHHTTLKTSDAFLASHTAELPRPPSEAAPVESSIRYVNAEEPRLSVPFLLCLLALAAAAIAVLRHYRP
jgi:hypothetical protein